jgi:thiol-disulfide isomerase/thioredoxin
VTLEELQDFLKRADGDQTGFLTTDDLYRNFLQEFNALNSAPDDMPRPEQMLPMFFRGELGMLESGPKLGEEAIDFRLPTHDGRQTVTLSASRGRPVVLIFGSFTCGPFRSQAGALEKLYARYKDEVDFYAIYIRDAHPTDGWQMNVNERAGVLVEQPKTQEARHLVASNCAKTLGLSMPMLVDTIDDKYNRAYSGFPDRLYLIDREGKIIYKGGRGPMGYKPRELEQTLIMLLLDEHLAREGR